MDRDPLALDVHSEGICRRFSNRMGTRDVLGLLGPPGSGKTLFSARFTRDHSVEDLKAANITYTNEEVKDLFWRNYKGLEYMGFSDREIRSMMMAYGTMDKLLSPPKPIPKENINRPPNNETKIALSTEYSDHISGFSPDLLLMDERSTRDLQHTGMPLQKLNLDNLLLTIIVGDPHQNINLESERSVLDDLNIVSGLEMIPHTWRMPEPIHRPSAYSWYDPPYEPHPSIARRKPVPNTEPTGKWELGIRPDPKLVLVHCEGNPQAETILTLRGRERSWKDPIKGKLADEIAREIANSYSSEYDVTVLAPYRAHTYNVQEIISKGAYRTSTVASFLGQETDFAISVVPKAGPGTLIERRDEVFNVEITRARFVQILVCNVFEMMRSSTRVYAALLNFAEHGLVLDEEGREVNLGYDIC